MNKFLITALFLFATACNAVEWHDLGKSDNKQVQTFIDYDSVKRQDLNVFGSELDYISAVIQPTYINNNPLRKRGLYYTKELWFISCEDNTYFINSFVDYGFKGNVVGEQQSHRGVLTKADFTYAFPETVGSYNIDQACRIAEFKGY